MLGGPPIQAICCRLFQSASSSFVKFFCTQSMAVSKPPISVTICYKTTSTEDKKQRINSFSLFCLNLCLILPFLMTGGLKYRFRPPVLSPEINVKLNTYPPELVQGTQHLLQLGHLLSCSRCLAVPIKVLGQLQRQSGHVTNQQRNVLHLFYIIHVNLKKKI